MFGLTHKITDDLLYLLHDMVEGMLQKTEHNLKGTKKEKSEEIARLSLAIIYYRQELQKFQEDIEEQRKQMFQFSIEELYNLYGQYDKFVGIEFHKFSNSARKYGRNIGGTFIYDKNERRNLEATINSNNIPRTNGQVKIDISSNYNLPAEQTKELIEVGFKSGDIYQILGFNTPLVRNALKLTYYRLGFAFKRIIPFWKKIIKFH